MIYNLDHLFSKLPKGSSMGDWLINQSPKIITDHTLNPWNLSRDRNNARVYVPRGTLGTYQTLANLKGSGYFLYWASISNNKAPSLRLTIDGNQYENSSQGSMYSLYGCVTPEGTIQKPSNIIINNDMSKEEKDIITGLCYLGIKFNTSLRIETKDVGDDTKEISSACDYVFDSELL